VGSDHQFTDMRFPATVSDFRLDMYEITVGRFRAFVSAGMGTRAAPPATGAGAHAQIPGSGWDASWNAQLVADTSAVIAAIKCGNLTTWTDAPGANENLAMTCITWYEAQAFCTWDGGYLPTETEWNYAAAGGSEQRAFPWSSPASSVTLDCTYANTSEPQQCVGKLTAVGAYSPKGDGKWLQADLTGNDLEWTLDYYSSSYPTPCTDCATLTASVAGVHEFRGGGWGATGPNVRPAYRAGGPDTQRVGGIGARCARAP
jgi:formylglycine-generating enzyme required for sulfatase activity